MDISYEGKNIISESQLNRTSTIDSVNFVRVKCLRDPTTLNSREVEGPGDAYWIKSYINGELQTDYRIS